MSLRRHPSVGPTGATGATGATGPAGTAPAGVPILRGPYSVDFSDIPHDGDTMTLWTPQVGDVILRLFVDGQIVTPWDHGHLLIGQTPLGASPPWGIAYGGSGFTGDGDPTTGVLDTIVDACFGSVHYTPTAYICHTTAAIEVGLKDTPGVDPTQGHVALYALIARAVAP